MTNWIIGGLIIIALSLGGFFFFGSNDNAMRENDSMVKDEAMMEGDTMTPKDSTLPAGQVHEDSMREKDDAMMSEESAMMQKSGSYEAYSPQKLALANDGKVVIYFHADWCSICRPLDAEMKANVSKIPAGVHILKANYDTETALKQKYGVTYQHTFVQVDAQGDLIKKWGDATTLAGVLARVQ